MKSRERNRRVLAVLTTKGGEGKTTLVISIATCLVRMGYSVLVVDTDPQQSLTAWYRHEDCKADFDVTHITNPAELEHLDQLPEKYDYIVVDGAATLNENAISTIVSADMVLVPVRASPLSFAATAAIMEFVDMRNKRGVLPVRFVQTMTLNRARLNTVLWATLNLKGYKTIKTRMRMRQTYPAMLAEGGTIYDDRTKAALQAQGEIDNITREILEAMNE